MRTSESINELATALAKAQPAFEAAGRDHKAKVETRTGGYYEFNYADFAAYLEVCRKPLGEHGLSFVQEATRQADSVSVVTMLMHTSGQWIVTEPLTLPVIADSRGAITAQIVGSAVTYGKRYSLSSLIGLASEADDDGNMASGNNAETGRRQSNPACPKCGTNEHVIKGKEEFGGGWLCWKNRGGCGEKWQDQPKDSQGPFSPHSDERNEAGSGYAKPDAKKVAEQHGLTTGDKIAPPKNSAKTISAYDKAVAWLNESHPIAQFIEFADKWEQQKIAKKCTPKEFSEIDANIGAKAIECCHSEADLKSCESLLRNLHMKMRISEGDYMELGSKLADKEASILQPAA
jgi:hypothetical protein